MSVTAEILLTLSLWWYFYGGPVGWPGGWVYDNGNKAISASIEVKVELSWVELRLSLAKWLQSSVTWKNSQVTLTSEVFLKNKLFILEVKIPPDLGENKFQKIPPYFKNSPRSGGKRFRLFVFFSIFSVLKVLSLKNDIFSSSTHKKKIFQVIFL